MKAIVVHQYGGPEVLKYEDYPDPTASAGQILIRVAAASVNPADIKRRTGFLKDVFPIKFPGIIGVDVAGTVSKVVPGVTGFSEGDKVFAYGDQAYAELCALPAKIAVKIPTGLDVTAAAALPVVTTTAHQFITQGVQIKPGQTILITGAVGSVGRAAIYVAKQAGARVIAGVLTRQKPEAQKLGADQILATDDDAALSNLAPLDAVADAVGGKLGALLMGKIAKGGVYASIVGPPSNAKDYPSVRVALVFSSPDPKVQLELAQAVVDKKLVIPIGLKLPLQKAAEAHATMEKGGVGKILLIP